MTAPDPEDLVATGRAILDGNAYLVLGTTDDQGLPWVSPVFFAAAGQRALCWVSKPGARHSRNLAARPDVTLVVFDSSVPIGTGRAVYLRATARLLEGDEAERAIAAFSARSVAHGGAPWALDDVSPPARHRLYGATVTEQWVLDEHDERVPVDLAG